MKEFMNEDFLLETQTAVRLYHEFAEEMPIFDYHCHISPREIAENKKYRNITELWLGGDHYKWRAIRSNGVDEKFITGDGDDKEKFLKWAETMQNCIGNPLYHWTHLELRRYFGIKDILSPKTAESIWERCNAMLRQEDFTAKNLIRRSNVKVVCTTDDPVDSLEYHKAIAEDKSFEVKVLPAFRPDKSINIEKEGFIPWLLKLEKITDTEIATFQDLKNALISRLEFFHQAGCRISDHALDPLIFQAGTEEEASIILQKALAGKALNQEEVAVYKTQILIFLGKQYSRLGWVMQLHMGTLRNTNSRMLQKLGPDTGFDSIGDWTFASALSSLLDSLDKSDELPKTILYHLNPRDNEILGTIIGCFQGGKIPGKVQFGSAWWFNDQKDGMERQLTTLANLGLLSRFVGMLTDSRSFLSYIRHEYFRRILCNILGTWVEKGEIPDDMELLGKMVQDICYNNAESYFGIE
ncbi:uronate isomerase [Ruminiclostridium hungatei]|uniref:Uronate isomerase n=1 Tax=Ruminiclostridium hungatei TaxID=48256 RepID=A0A1V4SPJ0_RUMHU|nr:glucuronate isomerase [Ruminiclostridium hungatei]OPX45754.1 uronate isomerase [Ruminiclostridium hungatei]